MYLFRKTKKYNKLEKWVTTIGLVFLMGFHIPQVYAEESLVLPENWSSDWTLPFANEQLVESTPTIVIGEVSDKPAKYTKYVVASAYSSDVHQTDASPFRPAMSMDFREEIAKNGVVNCVAHNDLRLGTKVRFPEMHGNVVYTVCDRMNTRYSGAGRVDFYFYAFDKDGKIDSKESLNMARANAKVFGLKRRVKMEIL